ncbi:MAG: hypothetical protein E7579_01090 [Ruminococcaceae bacterium]|nr:hypothetical protein [Oscillospiraceae bacterium]
MNSKRLISAFLTLVMLIGTLAVGVDAAWADKVNEDGEPIINYLADAYTSPEAKLADMIMVKEQNGYQLWYEEFTGEIAVVDLATGQVHFSNPWDIASGYQAISDAVKEKLLSQLVITFLENDVQKTMNSYTEAALRGQIVKKNIKNGIRVEYVLGEEQTIRLVPRMIQMARFEELILANIEDEWQYNKLNSFYTPKDANDPNLTERGVAEMQAKFPITLEMAVYVCDPEIKARELRELEGIIKSYCPEYTYEELDYDHDLTRYTGDDAAPPRFRMALEYTLSDTGLQVRLPANGLSFDESAYQFQEVAMLPYFGAGSNEFTGYSVIPDGSGALIRFEDFVGKPVNIAGQMYGADYAYHEISGAHAETMRMPYFGVVTNFDKELVKATETTPAEGIFYSNGFLAVVTEGDSLASFMAECGGTLHPYNTVYAKFTPRPSDEYNLADSISVSGNATWTVTSKRKYTDSYRIQYIFLKDETLAEENGLKNYYEAEWTGMATAYRDYLIEKGELTKLENTKEDIPLFIETFGSIETTERLLSFPIEVDTPLTTFEDIKTMHAELTELGVGNINFKLTGYANGGLEGTVPYRLEWTKVVGGGEGFTDLAKYAADNGFNVYPDFDFAYIRNQEMFDGVSLKKHAVRTIDDRFTTRRAYDAATQSFDRSFAIAISPVFYEYLYNKFGPNYLEYGNDAIAVTTLGTDLNSDFDEDEPYHREDNKQFTIELLEKLDADYESVMIEGGNAYAVKYADVILNASLTSSKYVKASESVPFLGMVYHGSKVFTGSATNMEGDVNQAILQAIENGAAMYFILSYQNTSELKEDFSLSKYYSVSYDIWKEDVAEYYTTLNNAIKDLQTSYIVDHEFLDAERIPDADELEADRLAEEAEAAALAAAEEEARLDEERKARLEARLAAQAGEVVEEPAAAPVEEEADETEEEVVEEEEEYIVPDKYKTVIGSVVRVEYEGGVNFILNYNSYDIIVEYDGQEYEIAGLGFVRID